MKQPPENQGHPCLKYPAPSARLNTSEEPSSLICPFLQGLLWDWHAKTFRIQTLIIVGAKLTLARTFRKHYLFILTAFLHSF